MHKNINPIFWLKWAQQSFTDIQRRPKIQWILFIKFIGWRGNSMIKGDISQVAKRRVWYRLFSWIFRQFWVAYIARRKESQCSVQSFAMLANRNQAKLNTKMLHTFRLVVWCLCYSWPEDSCACTKDALFLSKVSLVDGFENSRSESWRNHNSISFQYYAIFNGSSR